MPFTVSHSAAILPFNKKPFVLSALIMGSMSPDFLYFIPFIPNYHFTHTFQGLFLFCLPTSMIALLIYHKLLKHPFIWLLPQQVQSRLLNTLKPFDFFPISRFLWITCSILLGSLTHIVWDSFTHANGQAVLLFPFLVQPVIVVASETIFLYKLLQYLSTIVGGLIVLLWLFFQVKSQQVSNLFPINSRKTSQYWLPTMATISCLYGLLSGCSFFVVQKDFKILVVQTVIGSMSIFFLLLVMFSLAWYSFGFSKKN